jgi:hypothetical protein
MTGAAARRRLLRAYPATWRARYEDELLCFLDDEFGGGRLPVSAAAGLAVGGVVERARRVFDLASDSQGARASRGLVLLAWGWCLCVVGGIGFAKLAEHFGDPKYSSSHAAIGPHVADATFVVVQVAAVLGLAAVAAIAGPALLVAGAASSPAARQSLLRALLGATAAALVAGAYLAGVVGWAHTMTPAARNGASVPYELVVVGLAVVATVALLAATRAVVVALRLVRPTRRGGAVLAVSWTAAACMSLVALGAVAWWIAVAHGEPGFLGPTGAATMQGSTGWPVLLGCQVALAIGAVLAITGARRATRDNQLRPTT